MERPTERLCYFCGRHDAEAFRMPRAPHVQFALCADCLRDMYRIARMFVTALDRAEAAEMEAVA